MTIMKHNHLNLFNSQASQFKSFPTHTTSPIPIHITIHSSTTSISSMKIEKRKTKKLKKIDEYLRNRTNNYSLDSSITSKPSSTSTHSNKTRSIQMQEHIPLNIVISTAKRTIQKKLQTTTR